MKNELKYIDNQIVATIDKQKEYIDVYEIIKTPTQFYINKNIDTILNQAIDVDIFLGYTSSDNKIEGIKKGFVYVSVTNLSGKTEYLKTTIYFTNGEIKEKLVNSLPLGIYILNIEYPGNKYFEFSSTTLQFSINKKHARCEFDKEYYEQYPNQTLEIGARLLDDNNGKAIEKCTINYSFNGYEYITQTDKNGFANLIITMPQIAENECTGNLKYPLKIHINNETYKLISKSTINITLKKYETSVVYTSTIEDNKIKITGNVYAYDDNDKMINVDYGNIDFTILNFNETENYIVDKNGYFVFDKNIVQTENANVTPQSPMMFSTNKKTNINLDLPNGTVVKRDYVQKNNIKFVATVTNQGKNVPYGMVTFIITQNYNEIYRYITELNNYGEAFFYFDVSTIGEYEVKAEYHGIFEYQKSESDIKTYKIED